MNGGSRVRTVFRRKAALSFVIALLWTLPVPADTQPDVPEARAFLELAARNWSGLQVRSQVPDRPLPTLGSSGFIQLRDLIRGQDEISIDNIRAKLSEKIADGDLRWDAGSGRWIAAHDQGLSTVPIHDPVQVILGPQGPVIADGHHDVFLALFTGAATIAVQVQEDLSGLTPVQFWEVLKARDLVYLRANARELARKTPEMFQIRDNPNRYLASLLAFKVAARTASGEIEILKTKGARAPIWLKLNDSVPFIEFEIARALTEAGIRYESAWKERVPDEVVERSRVALAQARESGRYPLLNRIPILESRQQAVDCAGDGAALKALLRSQYCALLLK